MSLPLDDTALRLYLEALDSHVIRVEEDGPVMSGEFTIDSLLDFYSGVQESDFFEEDEWRVSRSQIFSVNDLVRTLVLEVMRLRARLGEEDVV